MSVAIGKTSKVKLEYKLTYDTADGELIEETQIEEPLEFTLGNEEMLDDFEAQLIGLISGAEFSFALTPEQAYGPVQETLLVEYPKDTFLVDDELDEDFLQPGEIITMTDEDGNEFDGIIEENKLNTVVVDFNHPLSGEHLHFKGKILEVS